MNDVDVERALHRRTGFLVPDEQRLWQLDAAINDRGIHLDAELIAGAIRLGGQMKDNIYTELAEITGGQVISLNQHAKLKAWLEANGCEVKGVAKTNIGHALTRKHISGAARRVLELRRDGAHAAAAKYLNLDQWRCEDGRAHGAFRFHGASTGRWTSLGIQLHNLKRLDAVEDVAQAIELISSGDLDRLRSAYAQPLAVIGNIVRAAIIAAPGYRLFVGDFSGIESRLSAWISGESWKLEQWAKFDATQNPEDEPYFINGYQTFGLAKEIARGPGKTGDLAFGYGGSAPAWKALAPPGDVSTQAEILERRDAWRRRHPCTTRFWKKLDRVTLEAVRRPGQVIKCGRLAFRKDGDFLQMKLPSGRKLSYPFPRLITNKRGFPAVSYKDNEKGKWVECRGGQGSYHAVWMENAVSAIARDIFAQAMLRLEAAGYRITTHVHDEIVVETPEGFGFLEEFRRLLLELPEWAAGLPLSAKVREGPRFCKIEPPKPAPPRDESAPSPAPTCVHCRLDPPDGLETVDAHNGGFLHARCVDAFLRTRLTEEGVARGIPSSSAQTPQPQPQAPLPPSPPPQTSSPSLPSRSWLIGIPDAGSDYQSGERDDGRPTASYVYRQANGTPYLRVLRTATKQFPQFHQENGRWIAGKPKSLKIPYRLPELVAAPPSEPIWICEGEKDADSVAALGLIATTNSEGAGKWTAELNSWFNGKQVVYLLEDNDEAGRAHVDKVASALQQIVPEIRLLAFPVIAEHGDVSDWLALGYGKAELLARAEVAPRYQPDGYDLVRASDIVPRAMDWLWQGHLLRGSQELMAGLPGNGKSQLHCAFVAAATTGGLWPDGGNGAPAGNVIMLTAEDCLDQTLVPRLIAAGANRERVFILRSIRKDNKNRMFLLPEDLLELERMIKKTGDIHLVTIDPITAYMGGRVDSHRATDVRGQLGPLAALAERLDIALAAITHPPKHATPRAIDHFIGSQAFIAAARIGHVTVEEIEEDEHGNRNPTGRTLFTNPKNNVSKKMPSLAYRVVEKPLEGGIKTTHVIFEEAVDISADQAVQAAAAAAGKGRGQAGNIVMFLMDMLSNGPVPANLIEERGALRGFSKDQLNRAKRKMMIITFKATGVEYGGWMWALPQHAPPETEEPFE